MPSVFGAVLQKNEGYVSDKTNPVSVSCYYNGKKRSADKIKTMLIYGQEKIT